MTEVEVWSLVRHNTTTDWGDEERNEHEWAAIHIKKIVKNAQLAAKANFRWPGLGKIWPEHRSAFERSLCQTIADKMVADGYGGSVIVPVPNSNGIVGNKDGFRTYELARSIAQSSGGQLVARDHLLWKKAVGKAHLNERARNVDEHMGRLVIVGKPDRPIILFDDIVTSGSQMCAAKIKLEDAGYQVAGCYAVLDVLDQGERGAAPVWKLVTRKPTRQSDLISMFFEDLGDLD